MKHEAQKKDDSISPKKLKKSVTLSFTSAGSLDDIKREPKHIRKMTFAERLKLEQQNKHEEAHEERRNQFGMKEMSYTVEDSSNSSNNVPDKFQKLRQKNSEHMKQRRKLIRYASGLKGRRKFAEV
ncbi:uncharacterized protein LOC108666545 isoform X2 [Hyalella azteca]|nr:uncharacterized protein LOC108666545 isoform X2 [Hyalella azteca]XP_018008932.1 uncharacterized protein LOC108666545 isoform X2 [Hyalella azteca]